MTGYRPEGHFDLSPRAILADPGGIGWWVAARIEPA